jgi:hypothetical protein
MSSRHRTLVGFGSLFLLAFLLLTSRGTAEESFPDTRKAAGERPSFNNPGVYRKVVQQALYEWIPTQDVTFSVAPDGKVAILAPPTKKSFNGAIDCRPFAYSHAHTRLTAADRTALFGDGLRLPPGNYGFAILWLNAADYDEVLAQPWNLTDNPDTFRGNSTAPDYVNISVIPLAPPRTSTGAVREVVLPYDLQRVSWLPHYQLLPHVLTLPPDKGFGITRLLWDIPLAQVYEKVTHIQYVYAALDQVPANRKWKTKQGLDDHGALASNEWLIANHPLDRDFITVAEMDETFGSRGIPDHAQRAQQVLAGIYQRMERELGVTSPSQTRLYDDYFSALEGYDNSASFPYGFNPQVLTEGLANQEMARRTYREGHLLSTCRYFSENAFRYRNWLQGGYLDSFARTPEGVRTYNEIYNYERKFMAAPDRKVLKFGWSNAEGCNSAMFRSGTRTRLHFENGDIIRQDVVAWPFHLMLNESFWALLLGNDYVLWHSNLPLVQNPHAFRDSGAAGAGNTLWQPAGGQAVVYTPDAPGQPQQVRDPRGQFPENPHLGESGAFAGAWLVSQLTAVSDRTSKSVEYATFFYRLNGGLRQSGYPSSDTPQKGVLGNARLSRYGTANYGQANIVGMYERKKPICVYTEGHDGGAVIYHNVHCGLTDRNDVTVTTETGTKTLSVVGNNLHVFYVAAAPLPVP